MDFKPRQHSRGYQWHAVGQAEARTRVQSPGQVPPHRFEVPSTPHCRHQRWQGPGCHVVSFLEYFPTSFFFFFFLNVAVFSYTFTIQGLDYSPGLTSHLLQNFINAPSPRSFTQHGRPPCHLCTWAALKWAQALLRQGHLHSPKSPWGAQLAPRRDSGRRDFGTGRAAAHQHFTGSPRGHFRWLAWQGKLQAHFPAPSPPPSTRAPAAWRPIPRTRLTSSSGHSIPLYEDVNPLAPRRLTPGQLHLG